MKTPLVIIPMIEDYLVQHTTSGLQTLDVHVTTTVSPSIGEVLPGIALYSVTLPFMSM